MKVFLTGAAGFIGSSIAAGLVRAGHQVTGLVRKPEQVAELATIGVHGIVGTLNDRALLIEQRGRRTPSSTRPAATTGAPWKPSSMRWPARINRSCTRAVRPSWATPRAARARSRSIMKTSCRRPRPTRRPASPSTTWCWPAQGKGVRASVLCNTLIYGHGALPRDSVQLPRLLKQARKSGIVRHVDRAATSGRTCISTTSSACICWPWKSRPPARFTLSNRAKPAFST